MDLSCVSKLFIRYQLLKVVPIEGKNFLAAKIAAQTSSLQTPERAANCEGGVCSLSDWKPGQKLSA